MNEIDSEIQALEAIFMEDLKVSLERNAIKLRVVPSFGGAFKNHVSVEFSARFPIEYPELQLQDISLKVLEGELNVEHLQNNIINEAQKLKGQPMVFQIIEKLKEQLELYNEDMAEGSFVLLSNEIMLQIFSYLSPQELGQLSLVNKKIKAIADDNILWKEIFCREPKLFQCVFRLIEKEPETCWKKEYIELMNLFIPGLNYLASIMQRKDTGDEWIMHVEHVANWRKRFQMDMFENFELKLTGETSGWIIYDKKRIGKYKFLDEYKHTSVLQEQFLKNEENLKDCPYITEKVLGYINFWPKEGVEHILKAVMSTSRGILTRLDKENSFLPCVKLRSVRVINILGKQEGDIFSELGFIVHPRKTRKRVKYLNDVVDAINTSLIPLMPKPKDITSTKPIFRPVSYNSGQMLYPFKVQEDQLIFNYEQRFGEPSITLWLLNVIEIYIIAGAEFYD